MHILCANFGYNTIAMKTRKRRSTRATAVPTGGVKRVVVEFPATLLSRAESVLGELAKNRSELIRLAVEQYLESLERAKLERELAEGYTANAAQARNLCEEFAPLESDLV
jgi:metal-responsive CopG/Arc/MetJ family transcriptional regulator